MKELTIDVAIHCMKAIICQEPCEECSYYGTTGTDHCEDDAVCMAIKALEMQEKLKTWIKRYEETQKVYGNDKSFSREKLIDILYLCGKIYE